MLTSRSAVAGMALVASLLGLPGCSGGDAKPAGSDRAAHPMSSGLASDPAGESTGTDLPGDAELREYFTAVSTYDASRLAAALELTERGSVAEAYAGYLLASANAAIDAGSLFQGEEPAKVDGGYRTCVTDNGTCVTWADIKGRNGKIVSFTVNGQELQNRLTVGSGRLLAAGDLGTIKLLYAYDSVQSEALFVVAEIASQGAPVTVATYDATYRSPAGRQSTAARTVGPSDLRARSTATVVMGFPNAEPGGTVSVSFFSADFLKEKEVTLPTR